MRQRDWYCLALGDKLTRLKTIRASRQIYTASQKHESTLLYTYVLNEFLTADRSCTKKIFLKKLLQKFVVHIFTLLLAHFMSKLQLVNYASRGESLNLRKISKSTTFSFGNSDLSNFKHIQRLSVSRKIDQFGRKRCQKKRKDMDYQLL